MALIHVGGHFHRRAVSAAAVASTGTYVRNPTSNYLLYLLLLEMTEKKVIVNLGIGNFYRANENYSGYFWGSCQLVRPLGRGPSNCPASWLGVKYRIMYLLF